MTKRKLKRPHNDTIAQGVRRPIKKARLSQCLFCREDKIEGTWKHNHDSFSEKLFGIDGLQYVPPKKDKVAAFLEVMDEILVGNGLITQDLLRIAHVSSRIYHTLFNDGTKSIWAAARHATRLILPPPPTYPTQISEHAWAALVFGKKKCAICKKETSEPPASYTSILVLCHQRVCRSTKLYEHCISPKADLIARATRYLPPIEPHALEPWWVHDLSYKKGEAPEKIWWPSPRWQQAIEDYIQRFGANTNYTKDEYPDNGKEARKFNAIMDAAAVYQDWKQGYFRQGCRKKSSNISYIRTWCKKKGWKFNVVRITPRVVEILNYMNEKIEQIDKENWHKICEYIEPEAEGRILKKKELARIYGPERNGRPLEQIPDAEKRIVYCAHCTRADKLKQRGRPFELNGLYMHLSAKHGVKFATEEDILKY